MVALLGCGNGVVEVLWPSGSVVEVSMRCGGTAVGVVLIWLRCSGTVGIG